MALDPHAVLRRYLVKNGLKSSRQREIIADVFFKSQGHLRVEDLLHEVHQIDPRVSQATVYRTMKLLADCGLASPRHFQDGHTRYELSDQSDDHHDHLICVECGKIVEFFEAKIEALQDKVADDHGFELTDHRMELYGRCEDCRRQG